MPDIFNYENPVNLSGAIASSDFATVILDGAKASLTQTLNCSYQQQVQEITQVGDPSVYWMPGRPSGSVEISKLVGDGGFFDGWKGKECGKIASVNVATQGGKCGFTGNGVLAFSGGVIESVSLTMNNGQMAIAETAKIKVSNLVAV